MSDSSFVTCQGPTPIGFGFLYGLFQAGVISLELAITTGILVIVFILSFLEIKLQLHPIKNALAEIQKYLSKELSFVPLHEIKPVGYIKEQSPMENTDLGDELLEQSGAKEFVDDNWRLSPKDK